MSQGVGFHMCFQTKPSRHWNRSSLSEEENFGNSSSQVSGAHLVVHKKPMRKPNHEFALYTVVRLVWCCGLDDRGMAMNGLRGDRDFAGFFARRLSLDFHANSKICFVFVTFSPPREMPKLLVNTEHCDACEMHCLPATDG